MHDCPTRLLEILDFCDYDCSRLSSASYAEAFSLARCARIELPRPGVAWPSSPGVTGAGEITPIA